MVLVRVRVTSPVFRVRAAHTPGGAPARCARDRAHRVVHLTPTCLRPYPLHPPRYLRRRPRALPPSRSLPPAPGVFARTAAALAFRDFRVLWLGACTSSVGTWMQKVAQSWLVLELTDSAWYLALDSFVGELPLLLFTLIGGVVADRRDRRKLLLASQVVQMSSAFALAAARRGRPRHGLVRHRALVLSGCAQAFGGPAYQSLIPSLVSKEHLPNAIALNSIQFNIARVIGPLLAGAALHAFGMVSCFTLNGVSFLVVIGALLSLHIQHQPAAQPKRMRDELRGGLRFVRAEHRLVALIILAFATTFLAIPLLTFLPVFARNVFHEGVGGYSHMMVFSGRRRGRGRAHRGVARAVPPHGAHRARRAGHRRAPVAAFSFSRAIVAERRHPARERRAAGDDDVARDVTRAAHRAERDARARHEHLHGGVPRRHAARQPRHRQGGRHDLGPHALAINGILLTIVAVYFLVRGHGVRDL